MTMHANEPEHDKTASAESQIGPLTGIFTLAGAGSAVGCSVLSQHLAPAVEAIGIDGLWIDVALLVGGTMLLWGAITWKGRAPAQEPVPAEG